MRFILKLILLAAAVVLALPVVLGGVGLLTALAVVLLVVLAPVAVLGVVCWGLYALLRGASGRPVRKRGEDWSRDETRLIQEIHNSLAGMERRIETLETILLDRASTYEEP